MARHARLLGGPTDFKKIGGKWLLDMTDNSSSSSEQQGSSTTDQVVPADAVLKTDTEAQTYLKTNLKTWDGIDLTKASYVDAFCNNGYYSKTETRTGRHLPGYQGQTNTAGEDVFPSFQCQLSVGMKQIAPLRLSWHEVFQLTVRGSSAPHPNVLGTERGSARRA